MLFRTVEFYGNLAFQSKSIIKINKVALNQKAYQKLDKSYLGSLILRINPWRNWYDTFSLDRSRIIFFLWWVFPVIEKTKYIFWISGVQLWNSWTLCSLRNFPQFFSIVSKRIFIILNFLNFYKFYFYCSKVDFGDLVESDNKRIKSPKIFLLPGSRIKMNNKLHFNTSFNK